MQAQINSDSAAKFINRAHGLDTTRNDYNSIHSGDYSKSRNIDHGGNPAMGHDTVLIQQDNNNSNSGTLIQRNGTRIDSTPPAYNNRHTDTLNGTTGNLRQNSALSNPKIYNTQNDVVDDTANIKSAGDSSSVNRNAANEANKKILRMHHPIRITDTIR